MQVTISVSPYPKRCKRPWIAKVAAWKFAQFPEYTYGKYLGDDNGGFLEIEAEIGDILRVGKRSGLQWMQVTELGVRVITMEDGLYEYRKIKNNSLCNHKAQVSVPRVCDNITFHGLWTS